MPATESCTLAAVTSTDGILERAVPGLSPLLHECLASAVERCHELAVGRTGSGKVVVAFLDLQLGTNHLLFEGGDPGLELLGVVRAADAELAADLSGALCSGAVQVGGPGLRAVRNGLRRLRGRPSAKRGRPVRDRRRVTRRPGHGLRWLRSLSSAAWTNELEQRLVINGPTDVHAK
ncbi:hypothetical protein SAV14893_091070 [Streptomyces avermitilis]|uniref:Uncharacterized protein n=1 Tax=Streptomyces avermitilis TaxID=33903 RepID=A0A4D4N802_STRAX|nr:hypothetical protein SAV14893_091070 [Streptomyces avermitilis]GDY79966.1 hypothetical protein SAV31267_094510 [Streptomyces avermitilis]